MIPVRGSRNLEREMWVVFSYLFTFYRLLVKGQTQFIIHDCLKWRHSSEFGPYWRDIRDVNLPDCRVPETSLRWSELCEMLHYPTGSNHQKMVHGGHKGMNMVSNNTQVGSRGPKAAKKLNPCFWPDPLNVTALNCDSSDNLLLSNVGEPVTSVALLYCS